MIKNNLIHRRTFISSVPIAAVGGLVLPGGLARATTIVSTQDADRPATIDAALVQEMVGVSHGNLDRMKELIEQEPTLVNAVMDWGGGDFESALGAAAHTGGRDRAMFLLENGARLNIFAATMLGWLDVIQPIVAHQPNIVNTLGPHGITLWSHARFGGEQARDTLAFLETVPGILKDIQLSQEERAILVGTYVSKDGQTFHLVERFNSLYLKRNNGQPIRMLTSANGVYHPIDQLGSMITIKSENNKAVAMTVKGGNATVEAKRFEE